MAQGRLLGAVHIRTWFEASGYSIDRPAKMHFLCLHGKGTNSQILETQLSAVCYQLGDGHTYEYVEGTVPEQAAPDIQALSSAKEGYFAYFDDMDAGSCLLALRNLERYIEVQGPFDGVIAFSQGGALAATLLVQQARRVPSVNDLKLAVFFSGGIAADPELLESGRIVPLDRGCDKEIIQVPTVHVWGAVETGELQWPPKLLDLCVAAQRVDFQHDGGHGIPSIKDRAAVTRIVQLIRRGVWWAGKVGNM